MIKNTLLVTICLVLSSVLGFVAQMVFVSSFGASGEMDIYFTLLSIPAVITGISPMIFSSVLIPTFARFKSNQLELNRFISSVWKFILILSILFTTIGVLFSLFNIDFFLPEIQDDLRNTAIQVSAMIWVGSGFIIMSSYLSAILQYNKIFITVAWTSVLPASFMIMFVLFFHEKLGVRSISLGFCFAFALQFIIFFRASKISLNFFSVSIKQIRYKKLIKQSCLVILSLLPFTVLVPIAFYWASKLEIGSVSYLGYSQSFAGFLSVATSMGVSIVSFPELADNFANQEGISSLYKFEQKLRYVLLIAMFATGAFIALRIPILTLFYQRGSFDAESVNNLASVVPWYLFAAVFVAGLNLLRNLFYSKGQFTYIARLGLIIPIIFFVLSGVLKEMYSFVGIGVAYALSFSFLFFMIVNYAKSKEEGFLTKDFLLFMLFSAISVTFASLIVTLSLPFVLRTTSVLGSIFVGVSLFTATYIVLALLIFRMEEIEEIRSNIIAKFKAFKYW